MSQYYLDSEELPAWSREAIFGNDNPIELEVGSGKGLFLATASRNDADRNFLGIEIARKYARTIAAKLARNDCPNAKIIHGDAAPLFQSWVPAEALDAVHVYFPDPWWKKRHRKRRIMNDSFVAMVHRALIPGGLLHFWTDVEEYFETTLEMMESTPFHGPMEVEERPAAHHLDYRTHFERRMRLHDEPVYRSLFQKNATASL